MQSWTKYIQSNFFVWLLCFILTKQEAQQISDKSLFLPRFFSAAKNHFRFIFFSLFSIAIVCLSNRFEIRTVPCFRWFLTVQKITWSEINTWHSVFICLLRFGMGPNLPEIKFYAKISLIFFFLNSLKLNNPFYHSCIVKNKMKTTRG